MSADTPGPLSDVVDQLAGLPVVGPVVGRMLDTQPPLDASALLVIAAVVLLLLAWAPSWRVLRHGVTLVHEASHGFVALLSGRRLGGIRLHSDSSGLTVSRGRPAGPGMVATSLAGYLGPSALGLVGAAAVSAGHPVALLWGLTLVVALLALQIRNWFGVWSVVVAGGLLAGVGTLLPVAAQSIVAVGLTLFLLLAAPRGVIDLHRVRRRRPGGATDADTLARLTRVPGIVWVGVFFVLTAASAALGCVLVWRASVG